MQWRVPRPRMSLATKCQLLFGVAVLVIVVAALLVPWQRMDQLTRDINERSADLAATLALADHAAGGAGDEEASWVSREVDPGGGQGPVWVELLPPFTPGQRPTAAEGYTQRFDADAWVALTGESPRDFAFSAYEGSDGPRYRFARLATWADSCRSCHSPPSVTAGGGGVVRFEEGREPVLGLVTVDLPSRVSRRQLMLNRALLISGLVLACGLAGFMLWLVLSRLILRPVAVLQDVAEQVAKGRLDARGDLAGGDEFEQLSRTLNQMLENMQEQEQNLLEANKSLNTKLGQMAESNVALYESNRLKSEFLANVSHELRTPLNSILGFTDLLRETAEMGDRGGRYLDNIRTSGRGLLELINDLLDLAKIEAGRMEVRPGRLSVGDLFETLAATLRPLLLERNLRLHHHVDRDVPLIVTDPGKLQQVLYNLLSNAIKFSPDAGRVDLTAERTAAGEVRLSVTDAGPGIAKDQQRAIFEKFRQLEGSHTRDHGGTGLGLAISKELVALLKGRLAVESVPGEGATFLVTLPVELTAEKAA